MTLLRGPVRPKVANDADGRITVFVAAQYETLTVQAARSFRDQLTSAIEQAERISTTPPNLDLFVAPQLPKEQN